MDGLMPSCIVVGLKALLKKLWLESFCGLGKNKKTKERKRKEEERETERERELERSVGAEAGTGDGGEARTCARSKWQLFDTRPGGAHIMSWPAAGPIIGWMESPYYLYKICGGS